jgi:hypothetical protein
MSSEVISTTPAEELLRLLLTEDKLPDEYTCYMEKSGSFTTVYAVTSLVRSTVVEFETHSSIIARRYIPM